MKNTQILTNHSSGCLLLNLQFPMPVQTERFDEGGQKKDRKQPITSKLCFFLCKILLNILSGAQRTAQNKKQRQFMTPLKQNQNAVQVVCTPDSKNS